MTGDSYLDICEKILTMTVRSHICGREGPPTLQRQYVSVRYPCQRIHTNMSLLPQNVTTKRMGTLIQYLQGLRTYTIINKQRSVRSD